MIACDPNAGRPLASSSTVELCDLWLGAFAVVQRDFPLMRSPDAATAQRACKTVYEALLLQGDAATELQSRGAPVPMERIDAKELRAWLEQALELAALLRQDVSEIEPVPAPPGALLN